MARIYQDNTDSLVIAESLAEAGTLRISDSLVILDGLSKKPRKAPSDAISIAESIYMPTERTSDSFSDSLVIVEAKKLTIVKSLSDSLVILESVYDQEIGEWGLKRYDAACHAGI